MGYYKGPGICWSGACTNPSTVPRGKDSEGNECGFCAECADRIEKFLLGEAMRIAADMVEGIGEQPQAWGIDV